MALCGLPATGKSTLAARLSAALRAPVLDKDRIRAVLFAPEDIEYSTEQDDFCCDVMHRTLAWLARSGRRRTVILDGRTYTRRASLEALAAVARRLGAELRLVECVCSEATALRRLEQDRADGRHPAADRTAERWRALRDGAEPVSAPKLVIDTDGDLGPAELERCLAWLAD